VTNRVPHCVVQRDFIQTRVGSKVLLMSGREALLRRDREALGIDPNTIGYVEFPGSRLFFTFSIFCEVRESA